MFRPRSVQLIAIVLTVGLAAAAARFGAPINEGRRALNMMGATEAAKNAPPQFAFWVQALGAFRGLLIDIAFIRANEYKEKGRYHDAMQLRSLICDLLPRMVSVWEFAAWDMAWNISVTTYTPEERWNWVYNGVKLLRDRGIQWNPRAINLYKQLAWIFVNKMSETTDEHHYTYKREWAWRMHLLFGPAPNPLGGYNPDEIFEAVPPAAADPLLEAARIERERRDQKLKAQQQTPPELPGGAPPPAAAAVIEQPTVYDIQLKAVYDRIRAIADAPDTLVALHAAHPATRAMVEELGRLGVRISDDKLTEDEYWNPQKGQAFTFFFRWRQLADPPSIQARISRTADADADAAARAEFDRILGVRKGDPDGQALLRFVQKKVLREVYKLEAAHMAELVQLFGPMDWRVVDAHSLYWISRGLIAGGETVSSFGNDKTNTSRLLFFSLRNLRERNRIIFEPYPPAIHRSYFNTLPDLNFIEPLHRAYLTYGAMIDPDPGRGGAGETFRTGHINFLRESVILLYLADREREAQKYYDYLRQTYYTTDAGELNPEFAKPLDAFVTDVFFETIEGGRETARALGGILLAALNELAEGNFTTYNRLVERARKLHARYQDEKLTDISDSKKLPPFFDIQVDALRLWLSQPAPNQILTRLKASLWKYAKIDQKQIVYDDLLPGLTEECAAWDFDVSKAFPEPPGMEEYRKANPGRGPAEKRTPAITPAQPS